MKKMRRNYTAVFKAKVAVAALKGDKTLAEIADQFEVHVNPIAQWREANSSNGRVAFSQLRVNGENRQGLRSRNCVDATSIRSLEERSHPFGWMMGAE